MPERGKAHNWLWIRNAAGEAELRLEGEIAGESWWGDEITPQAFRDELAQYGRQHINVWINSPGGDVFAGSAMYTALKEYKGKVTVKIDGLAASAASLVAMAGDEILMSPTATMMIHNPWAMASGDARDMDHMAQCLRTIAEGLVAAYQLKTNLPKEQIQQMLDDETFMNAEMAVEMGFADRVLYQESEPAEKLAYSYTKKAIFALANTPLNKDKPSSDAAERQRLIDACHTITKQAMGRIKP